MVAVAVCRCGYQPSVLTEWEMGDGPANAVEDNMQGTVENKGAAKGTGEDDDDDDDGSDKDHNLFPMEDDADDDGIVDDDDDAGDDDNTDDEDNMDDDETNILDVDGLILSNLYTIWLRLQVVYFDALHTLWKLPQNNSKITIQLLSTPYLYNQKRTPWWSVVEEIMSNSVSLPLDAEKDVAKVIQTLEKMEQDNVDFGKGLKNLSLKKTRRGKSVLPTFAAATHCEANIVDLMFASEKDLPSSEKFKFSWKEIEVSCPLLSYLHISLMCCDVT